VPISLSYTTPPREPPLPPPRFGFRHELHRKHMLTGGTMRGVVAPLSLSAAVAVRPAHRGRDSRRLCVTRRLHLVLAAHAGV
jgi:hypothetical protein